MKIDPEVRREVWDDLQSQMEELQTVMRQHGIGKAVGQISNPEHYLDETIFYNVAEGVMGKIELHEITPDLEIPPQKVIALSLEVCEVVSTLQKNDSRTGFLAYCEDFKIALGDFILSTSKPEDLIDRTNFQLPAEGEIKIEVLKAVKAEWTTDYARIAEPETQPPAPEM